MNVSVGANWEAFIAGLVKEGRYASASEIMREGLRLVQEREEKRRALREMIDASIAEGGSHSSEEVIAGIRARAEAMRVAG